MGQVGEYGAHPVVAQFQGFLNEDGDIITRAAQNCVIRKVQPGNYALGLDTRPDDSDFLPQVQQYGVAPASLAIIQYVTFPGGIAPSGAIPEINEILFSFGVGGVVDLQPNQLFSITVYQCTDGINLTSGNP
jgi:hypothetical protein